MHLLPRVPRSGTSKLGGVMVVSNVVFFLGGEQVFSLWKNAATLGCLGRDLKKS